MFLPLIPELSLAKSNNSSYASYFAYRWKIAWRASTSGNSNFTDKSILDSIAASKSYNAIISKLPLTYFRFVAQISSTFVLLSNESIFLNSVDRILRLASCISPSLDYATASISSRKIITRPNF